jgi:hypothetical protein
MAELMISGHGHLTRSLNVANLLRKETKHSMEDTMKNNLFELQKITSPFLTSNKRLLSPVLSAVNSSRVARCFVCKG